MNGQYKQLVDQIGKAANETVTIEDAERIAGFSLFVMNSLSEQLKTLDIERRMRKSGLKAIKSATRITETKKHDKKPTEGALDDAVNTNELVISEEQAFDDAEVETEETKRQYDIAAESHLYFRSLMKGT